MKATRKEEKSQVQPVSLKGLNKPCLAILIHSAAISTYSVIHMGIKALNWVIHWLKVTVSLPFICSPFPFKWRAVLERRHPL